MFDNSTIITDVLSFLSTIAAVVIPFEELDSFFLSALVEHVALNLQVFLGADDDDSAENSPALARSRVDRVAARVGHAAAGSDLCMASDDALQVTSVCKIKGYPWRDNKNYKGIIVN